MTTPILREAAQAALTAMSLYPVTVNHWKAVLLPAAESLRAALAQPVPDAPACFCREPLTLGVVHRADGPCYFPDAAHVAQQAEPAQDLAAALGWPGGISAPLSWPELLQKVAQLRVAAHPHQPAPSAEPVAYSVGRTLHWHEGQGITDAQLYAAPQPAPDLAATLAAVHAGILRGDDDRELLALCERAWKPNVLAQRRP
jgi:hypothetical protein